MDNWLLYSLALRDALILILCILLALYEQVVGSFFNKKHKSLFQIKLRQFLEA